jgi:hypothetical protein
VSLQRGLAGDARESGSATWAGRIISLLVILFLVFDEVTKVMREKHVLAAPAQLGYSAAALSWIGAFYLCEPLCMPACEPSFPCAADPSQYLERSSTAAKLLECPQGRF